MLHHAGSFVPKHSGKGQAHWVVAHAEIGMAQTDGGYPHQYFVVTGLTQLQRLNLEISSWPFGDGGLDLHAMGSKV
jgi:hypothetical protein